jgi:hypothetical protein
MTSLSAIIVLVNPDVPKLVSTLPSGNAAWTGEVIITRVEVSKAPITMLESLERNINTSSQI